MRTRKVYLLKDDAFVGARTKTIDINVVDPINSIDIIVEMTNGGTMTEASVVKPHDEFTGIELVSGGDVLVSCNMEDLQALNFVEEGRAPYMELNLHDSVVQKEACRINFGVSHLDPFRYLIPTAFKNLQLKITNTFTAAAATTWAAAGHSLSVIANVIEEGVKDHKGFLTTILKKAYTVSSGAIEPIDLPTDFPYRMILISSMITTKRPDESITSIKLTCDADKYVAMEVDGDHMIMDNIRQFGRITQVLKKRMTNAGDAIYADLWFDTVAQVQGETTETIAGVTSCVAEKVIAETCGQTA